MMHFSNANTENFESLFVYTIHVSAKYLQDHGVHSMNMEQDLGLPGLRIAKSSWNPVKYLKKLTIQNNN